MYAENVFPVFYSHLSYLQLTVCTFIIISELVCVFVCMCGSVPTRDPPWGSPLLTSTKVIVGEDTNPALTPRVTVGLYDGDSQRKWDNRITIYMLCVCAWPAHTHESPHSTCLHTRSIHAIILCMHACVCAVCWPVCASWVMASPALKAEQFACGKVRVQQITVCISASTL